MSIEMRPLSGTRPLYVDEPEPFWPAGDDPDLYKLELWRLHKVGLVQGLRSVPCWKCGYLVIQSGLFLELEGRDGYHCRVVSWSDAHNAGILSQPFLRTLSDCWRVGVRLVQPRSGTMEDQVRQTGRDMGQRLAMERMRPRKTMTADAASSRRGISVAE